MKTFASEGAKPKESESGNNRESRKFKTDEVKTFARVSLAPSPDTRGRLATIRPEKHDSIHLDHTVARQEGKGKWFG